MALTTVSMVAAAKPEGKGKPKTEDTGPRATGRGSYVNLLPGTTGGTPVCTGTCTTSFEYGIDGTGANYGKLKHADRESGLKFSGSLPVCYTPLGDATEVVFGGEITSSSGQWPPVGYHYLVKVVDNGAGKAANPDQIAILIFPSKNDVLQEGGVAGTGSSLALRSTIWLRAASR